MLSITVITASSLFQIAPPFILGVLSVNTELITVIVPEFAIAPPWFAMLPENVELETVRALSPVALLYIAPPTFPDWLPVKIELLIPPTILPAL